MTRIPWATLEFHGAAGTVTGANFLLEIAGKKILVDCGLHQGTDEEEKSNWNPFPYDPASIDVLLVTHAHMDHIGRIPKLIKDGFAGVIYSTAPTKEISHAMFLDAIGLLIQDAKELGWQKLYSSGDIDRTLALWKPVPYHSRIDLGNGVTALLYDAGHVLGSSLIEIAYEGKKILFTGDMGSSPSILLRDTETFEEPHYLVMESVYGDRTHEYRNQRIVQLEQAIENTIQKRGTLLIPAFSLERTQELLFELNNLVENGRIPKVPMYLDSPLAIAITEIYRRSTEFFNQTTRSIVKKGDDIFAFPGLRITQTSDESKAINRAPAPKIIIAGSGMMTGGRILHHARQYLPKKENTLLLVGYQAAGTLGRHIQNGEKEVRIFGEPVRVEAHVETITGYSGHKDSNDLLKFVEDVREQVSEVFCVMGEQKSALFLAQRIRDTLGIQASAPEEGKRVQLF